MFYLESFQWVLINSDKPEIFSERFKVWKPNIKSKKQMWFEFCSSHFKNWLPYITGSQIWQWQAASVLCGQTIPALFIALRAGAWWLAVLCAKCSSSDAHRYHSSNMCGESDCSQIQGDYPTKRRWVHTRMWSLSCALSLEAWTQWTIPI